MPLNLCAEGSRDTLERQICLSALSKNLKGELKPAAARARPLYQAPLRHAEDDPLRPAEGGHDKTEGQGDGRDRNGLRDHERRNPPRADLQTSSNLRRQRHHGGPFLRHDPQGPAAAVRRLPGDPDLSRPLRSQQDRRRPGRHRRHARGRACQPLPRLEMRAAPTHFRRPATGCCRRRPPSLGGADDLPSPHLAVEDVAA